MTLEIKRPIRADATLLALLVIAPGCSSALPLGPIGGNAGTSVSTGSGGATGGTIGARCDYQNPAATCAPGEGCRWECFGDGSGAECVPLPTACDASLDPVCGCDGKTYVNDCVLQQAAIMKDHDGECLFAAPDALGTVLLRAGVWSGTGIRMNVTTTSAALFFGCASGTIDEPLKLMRESYAVLGPLARYGWWRGTLSRAGSGGAPADVGYKAHLSGATLMLSVMDQSWTLRYEDAGAPTCP